MKGLLDHAGIGLLDEMKKEKEEEKKKKRGEKRREERREEKRNPRYLFPAISHFR